MEESKLSPSALESFKIPNLPPSFYYIPNFISQEEEQELLSKIYEPTARWQNLTHRRLQVLPSPLTSTNVLLLNMQTSQPSSTRAINPLPPWLTRFIQPRLHALGLFSEDPSNASSTAPKPRLTAPNHCLINEYPPGQGIMPHEDGAAYRPIVATVSLGSHAVLDLYDKNAAHSTASAPTSSGESNESGSNGAIGSNPQWRILQEPRSLLVTTGTAYECCLHGIADIKVDENLHSIPDGVAPEVSAVGIVNWDLLADTLRYSSGQCRRGTRVSLTFRDVVKVKNVSKALFGK